MDQARVPSSASVQLVQRLFIRHSSTLRGFILGLLPDFHIADDVLQDVFMIVTAKADQFEPDTNFFAWASTIAKLKVLEYARASRGGPRMLSPEVIESLCAASPPVSDNAELSAALAECVGKLAPRAQAVIQMRYGDGIKPMQIARNLDWKDESVHVALSRARAFLRECLKRSIARTPGI